MRTPAYKAIWRSRTEVPAFVSVAWRDLTLGEIERYMARSAHERIVFCDIYETCLIEGPSLEKVPAGIVVWIAKQQLEQNPLSGKFRPLVNALLRARERVQSSWFVSAKAIVAATFRYTFEEIDGWSPDVFFERVAQAERLTGVPLEPMDPDKPQSQPKGKGKAPAAPAPRGSNVNRKPSTEVEQHSWNGSRRPG